MIVAPAYSLERIVIDHAHVATLAKKRAAGAYEKTGRDVPKFFRELNYDTYRRISFRPDTTLWRDNNLHFQLQFSHPGYLFNQVVRINEFTETHAQAIPFSRNFFDYHDLDVPLFARWGLGFAGFRILNPLHTEERWDEIVSFLGASYFRALGKEHVYGASARGLAINAGGPGEEEFPAFVEFWIRKPATDATTVTVHALMDSPSVAGAYTFIITPGIDTVIETRATLFFRKTVENLGLVPLSSMFWFGEGSANRFGDFRPEVHDSDGLLIATDENTRLWRPLQNPASVTLSDYDTPAFGGFGLLQRDRLFKSYEDLEANYQRRPGVWIEPLGKWPAGKVRLVEIPAINEYHDNVTAFWTPKEAPAVGQPFEIAWRQRWTNAPSFGGPTAWVAATRQTVHDGGLDRTKFVIDFDPASITALPAQATITADVSVTEPAKVVQSQLFRNMSDGSRRLVLHLQAPVNGPAVDVRARLVIDGQPASETWTTRWDP